jgi:hypothetical protein
MQHFGFKPATEFKYGDILKIPKFENIPTEDINDYAESVWQFGNSELLNEIEEMVEYDSDNDMEEEMANFIRNIFITFLLHFLLQHYYLTK